MSGKLLVVVDPTLKKELYGCSFRPLYKTLFQAGRIYEYNSDDITLANCQLEKLSLKSNDKHILALARVSGARILYSEDENLHYDFKQTSVIGSPKGKIYQSVSHAHVLDEGPCACAKSL